ncbi:thymidylate synthase [Chryseobacterium sp. PS-8]|uniref:Thymidylate synthase n=1 Tax=Chryseobacterium indicum TaxID=2766954 RepID=A0ABS9CB85_9FLAO|nr:thymidylate synthase [Chryseobacterium sp. PS-8]MCF2221565.1 thymidylate synthase [Chryseobacterium sp. PS-8]
MQYREFTGINSFLVGMSKMLLQQSVVRNTRGFKCYELACPIIIKITNPLSRLINIPKRKWNYMLPYIESLWLASGRNDIDMVSKYVKKLRDFSDDNITMRAGYGPRLRHYKGLANDYNIDYEQKKSQLNNGIEVRIDQFKFVEKSFMKDPFTRQAVITLIDPSKDLFDPKGNLKITKDFPCTTTLQFIQNGGKLDLIVNMRSNDFIWGASGVNIFNFTFIQEYFAQILNLPIGEYYHIVNNFHYYEQFKQQIEELASIDDIHDECYHYQKGFNNLDEFYTRIKLLEKMEHELRVGMHVKLIDFDDDFFNDWAKVIYSFYNKSINLNFSNPQLNSLVINN